MNGQRWNRLRHLFECDDGSLPEIRIAPLSDEEIVEIYEWVLSIAKLESDNRASAWSIKEQRDIPLKQIDRPAKKFVDGELQPFHHLLSDLKIGGLEIPELGIFVGSQQLSFDYRMGAEWGPSEVDALLVFLKAIHAKAKDARMHHHLELVQNNPNNAFANELADLPANK